MVLDAIERQLVSEPLKESRNRKPLRPNPIAPWELRVGGLRVFYEVTAAGFKLAGKSEINANKKDTKDYDEGVWTLPPTYRLGDKDRAKYAAIGESDRMTLKFVKVAAKK